MAHLPRPKVASVDEYQSLFSGNTPARIVQLRKCIKQLAPDAQETISYAIPAYKLRGKILVYFAAYEQHIGVYPIPKDIDEQLAHDIAPYIAGKGTLRFDNTKPLPLDLITRVVRAHIARCLQ